MYLEDMPLQERHKLCLMLDEKNIWKILALEHMGYKEIDLMEMKQGNSPTDELLILWNQHHHTVDELSLLLHQLIINEKCDINILECIKNLVSSDLYQKLERRIAKSWRNRILQNGVEEKLNNTLRQLPQMNINRNYGNLPHPDNNSAIHSTDTDEIKMKKIRQSAGGLLEINYWELKSATNNWSEDYVLGRGGFGKVFHGKWKESMLAIKCLTYAGGSSNNKKNFQIQCDQILTELKYLNCCRHDNILALYAFSINGPEPCLVYQYMAGGSLEKRLFTKKELDRLKWMQRLNIAKGTSSGLQYLHTFQGTPVIHGDIKSANILLDSHCEPKIGDFGLVREGPNDLKESMTVTKVYGTKQYLPEEFLRYKVLSTNVDVYSFGIVLFELVTGLRVILENDKTLKDHVIGITNDNNCTIKDLMDTKIPTDDEFGIKISTILIKIGKECVNTDPNLRPIMVNVCIHLKKLYEELQELFEKIYS